MSNPVDQVVASARALRAAVPRSISRDPGPAGEAWDSLVDALDLLDPDHVGSAHTPAVTQETAPADPFGGLGAFVRSAVALSREVDRLEDADLSAAWNVLLETLAPDLK